MKKNSILSSIVILILVGILGVGLTTGFRYLNENNNMQKEAKIALEDYINTGRDFPVGEYVSLEARWVIGPYANETSTRTTNGISATAGVVYYYFLVLEDGTIMTLEVENAQDKATLDRMSEWLVNVDGYPMNGETLKVQGKLRELKSADLLRLYQGNLLTVFGVTSNDEAVRYLILDTTAGREGLYLIIGGIVALLVLVLFIRSRVKKKKAAEAVQNPPETTTNAW